MRFFILAVVLAVAVARPELYKEQEDFQYSRSSSDDGTKAGYYGSQRGNMGGNYERAHNMDSLAQNQMSGLVRQVEGELGDGSKTRTGSVYSAANSKGTYGSGHFDLSNLAGRNFHEGTYNDNSQSRSSSSSYRSNDYANSNSQSYTGSRYRGYQRSDAQTQTDNLQSLDNLQENSQLYGYGGHNSGFQSQAGFPEHGDYDHSNTRSHSGYGSNAHTRLISTAPVRVVLRPGSSVIVPLAAQTYDAQHGSSAFAQTAQNSDTAVISENSQDSIYKPADAKHYESSYSYHKKWEKHDTIPTVTAIIPSGDAIPINSELLEDNEAHTQYNGRNSLNERSDSTSRGYSAVKSSSSQHQSNYNSQHRADSLSANSNAFTQAGHSAGAYHDASSNSNMNRYQSSAHNFGANSDLNNQFENLDTKPKSYQSSYSYHKSWERQGDPYVIKPASGGYYTNQAPQRLSSGTKNQGYTSYQSGSGYNQNQAECDENGHIRIARSSHTDNQDMQQQSQNIDDDDLVQQIQSTWQNLGDLNQNSEGLWELQNSGKQSQNQWDVLGEFNQQSQSNWDQQNVQSSRHQLDSFEGVRQQTQNLDQSNINQESQNKFNNLEDLSHPSPNNNWDQQNLGQQTQNTWDNLENLSQQSQTNWEQQNVGQESQSNWEKFENIGQASDNFVGQNTDLENLRKHAQNFLGGQNQDKQPEQIQKEHSFSQNNTFRDLFVTPGKELNKNFHRVETPWDKFDILDSSNKNKSKVEHKTGSDDFYWHHMSNNGVDDQQVNKLNANGDIISEFGSDAQNVNTHVNLEQPSGYVSFDNNYNNPNVHYSYSNGFVNPTIYNKRNLNESQNSSQIHESSYNKHNSQHNQYSQVTQRENTMNSNTFSQVNKFESSFNDTKILGFWDKLENIEKESTLSRNEDGDRHFPESQTDFQNSKYGTSQLQNNIHELNSNYSQSKYTPQSLESLTINQTTNQMMPKQELQHENKGLISDTSVPKEIESSTFEEAEKTQDIGRGDISADDFSNKHELLDILPTPYDIPDIMQGDSKNNNSQLSVLGLEQQNIQTQKNFNATSNMFQNHQVNQNKSQSEVESNEWKVTQKDEEIKLQNGAEHEKLHQQKIYNLQQHNAQNKSLEEQHFEQNKEQQDFNNFEQNNEQQTLQQFAQNHEQTWHELQQNNEQHTLTNFEQNNEQPSIHNFEQNNEEQNLQQFDQNNEQQTFSNFEQNNEQQIFSNFQQNNEQQTLHNFEPNSAQQTLQNFEQNNEQQFIHNFEQESLHNFEQDKLHSFAQNNEHGFIQQNENLDQERLNKQTNGQNILENTQKNENLDQQNSNKFGQEFMQENENLEQSNLHNFEQQYMDNFANREQTQQLFNIGQENVQYFSHHTSNSEIEIPHSLTQERSFSVGKTEKQPEVNLPNLEQNIQPYQKENGNQQELQLENLNKFWLGSEQLHPQNLENSEQENISVLSLQEPNFKQQSFLDSKNVESQSDKLERAILTNNKDGQVFPEVIEEHVVPTKVANIESVIEPVTAKPGFWKSVGDKFSNAKSKVASWFRS